jgi:hypothetical protein
MGSLFVKGVVNGKELRQRKGVRFSDGIATANHSALTSFSNQPATARTASNSYQGSRAIDHFG